MNYCHKLPSLKKVIFLKRYKRFIVDVQDDTNTLSVHCPNSGSMKGLLTEGMPAWISTSSCTKRKLPHTLELVQPHNTLVGVNTHRANHVVHDALNAGLLKDHYAFNDIKREQSIHNSRFDFLLSTPSGPLFLEVKSVTLTSHEGALFPDAVTQRGTKHIQDLINLSKEGVSAALLFLVQREDCTFFTPAGEIDPAYEQALLSASHMIDIHICVCHITPENISITRHICVQKGCPPPWSFVTKKN